MIFEGLESKEKMRESFGSHLAMRWPEAPVPLGPKWQQPADCLKELSIDYGQVRWLLLFRQGSMGIQELFCIQGLAACSPFVVKQCSEDVVYPVCWCVLFQGLRSMIKTRCAVSLVNLALKTSGDGAASYQ